MKIVRDTSDYVLKWVSERVGTRLANGKAFAVVNADNEIVGGLVYHDYDPQAGVIELSAASSDFRWLMSPEVVQFMYDYPFIDCNAQLLIQRNSAKNERLNRQLRRAGYNEYRIPRLRGRDEDGIIFTATKEQWDAHPWNMRNRRKAKDVRS